MRRFTINELSELTNKKFAAEILQDVLNSRTNPNTPLADKLRGAIYELENADQPNTVQEQIHVMSWAEVFGVESDGLVYIETFKGCITPAIVTDKTQRNGFTGGTERFFATQQLGGSYLKEDNFLITWRCWNRRPSYELCMNTPWQKAPDGSCK